MYSLERFGSGGLWVSERFGSGPFWVWNVLGLEQLRFGTVCGWNALGAGMFSVGAFKIL